MKDQQLFLKVAARSALFSLMGAWVGAFVTLAQCLLFTALLVGIFTWLEADALLPMLSSCALLTVPIGTVVGATTFLIAAIRLCPEEDLLVAFRRISLLASTVSLVGSVSGGVSGTGLSWIISLIFPNSTFVTQLSLLTWYLFIKKGVIVAGLVLGYVFGALLGFCVGAIGGVNYSFPVFCKKADSP